MKAADIFAHGRQIMKKIGRETKMIITTEDNPRSGEGSFERLRDGRIIFVFTRFSGSAHDHGCAELFACTSDDEGESWSEPFLFLGRDDAAQNYMSPSLFRMKSGGLGMIYLRKSKPADGRLLCVPYFRSSDDDGKTWSEQVPCIDRAGYYPGVNDSAIVLSSGRILLPTSLMGDGDYKYYSGVVKFCCSDDNGATWKTLPGEIRSPFDDGAGFVEPFVYEHEDGSLWTWFRTGYNFQYQARSTDGGESWHGVSPNLCFTSPDAPMNIKRTGRYTVSIYNPAVRSCLDDKREAWGSVKRTPLVCAASDDDGDLFRTEGKTTCNKELDEFFKHVYFLEDDPKESFCYPAIFGVEGGFVAAYYHSYGTARCLNCTRLIMVDYDEIR